MRDHELRALEREAGPRDPDGALRLARALDRKGRADEALAALRPHAGDAAVRRALAAWPAWTHPWGGCAGGTWALDAAPLAGRPRVLWRRLEPAAGARERFAISLGGRRLLLATPLAVVTADAAGVTCLEPETGARRWTLAGAWPLDGRLPVVVVLGLDLLVHHPAGEALLVDLATGARRDGPTTVAGRVRAWPRGPGAAPDPGAPAAWELARRPGDLAGALAPPGWLLGWKRCGFDGEPVAASAERVLVDQGDHRDLELVCAATGAARGAVPWGERRALDALGAVVVAQARPGRGAGDPRPSARAVDPDGRPRWSAPWVDDLLALGPARALVARDVPVDPEEVRRAGLDPLPDWTTTEVTALDRATGEVVARLPGGAETVALARDVAYLARPPKLPWGPLRLFAASLDDGAVRWSLGPADLGLEPEGPRPTLRLEALAPAAGRLYALVSDGTVVALAGDGP